MGMDILTTFIESGEFKVFKVGKEIDFSQGKWTESVETHMNGNPVLYQCEIESMIIHIGSDENKIAEYLYLRLDDQPKKKKLLFRMEQREFNMRQLKMSALIDQLNLIGCDWKFDKVLDKVVSLSLINSKVQFIFSYDPQDSISLFMIQTPCRY
jgi:hypothetical protein